MYAALRTKEPSIGLPQILQTSQLYTAVGIVYDPNTKEVLSENLDGIVLPSVTFENRVPKESDVSQLLGEKGIYLSAERFQKQRVSDMPNTKYFLAAVTPMEKRLYGGNWVAVDLEELLPRIKQNHNDQFRGRIKC